MLRVFAVVGAFVILPAIGGVAQGQAARSISSPDTVLSNDKRELAVWHTLIEALPTSRPLRMSRPVSEVILATKVDGGISMLPVTSMIGSVDQRSAAGVFESIFPESQPHYPLDSIKDVARTRAEAWVNRLNRLSGEERAYAIGTWKSVPLAQLAVRASNDSMARRIFETRIAALASAPAEKSYVLFTAVATLADPSQDSARLVRNVALAEEYLKRLHAVPVGGYKTKHDSLAVMSRQWRAEDTIIAAYTALGDTANVLEHARRMMAYVTVLAVYERSEVVSQAYTRAVKALAQTRENRARLKMFESTVLAAARLAATDVPKETSDDDRNSVRNIEPRIKEEMERTMKWLGLLDKPALSISMHLVLNTSDSLYVPTPRQRTFDDGRVHAVMFLQGPDDQRSPGVLSRIQQQFSKDVDVLLVTNTVGYAGPEIVSPVDEAAWLKRFLVDRRRLTIPIAIWAGAKRPAGFVPEGHYAIDRPEPEPNSEPYYQGYWRTACALIDRHGVLRYFQDVATRVDEVVLHRRIQQLIDEPPATSAR